MSTAKGPAVTAVRRFLTHPLTPGVVIAAASLAVAGTELGANPPILVAWVVLALAAGYSISGSV